jgi:short-subunit dehydrogenase
MRWVLLGATSGLGKAFYDLILPKSEAVLSISRKAKLKSPPDEKVICLQADFSKTEQWDLIYQKISEFNPEKVVYFAAGGPFGFYDQKKFSDHQWAWRVSFEFPAFLLHRFLQEKLNPSLRHICFIGSEIAENKPDPKAASYAAAKHALRGLLNSVNAEMKLIEYGRKYPPEILLFSPGYMDTPMLPQQAWPRAEKGLVSRPDAVALQLFYKLTIDCKNSNNRLD